MKTIKCILSIGCGFVIMNLYARAVRLTYEILDATPVNRSMDRSMNKVAVRLTNKMPVNALDEPIRIAGVEFQIRPIALNSIMRLLPDVDGLSGGFFGVSFRINEGNSTFEGFYLRPVIAQDSIQISSEHNIHYFSLPDYRFDRLRQKAKNSHETTCRM